jgi:hypothetical protein
VRLADQLLGSYHVHLCADLGEQFCEWPVEKSGSIMEGVLHPPQRPLPQLTPFATSQPVGQQIARLSARLLQHEVLISRVQCRAFGRPHQCVGHVLMHQHDSSPGNRPHPAILPSAR